MMQRPVSAAAVAGLREAIAVIVKDAITKDLGDYIAKNKFTGEELKAHLEAITAFILDIIVKDYDYFMGLPIMEGLKVHIDLMVSYLKDLLQTDPTQAAQFAAGEFPDTTAIAAFIKELAPRSADFNSSAECNPLNAAIAIYLKDVVLIDKTYLAKFAAGLIKNLNGRLFQELQIPNNQQVYQFVASEHLVSKALALDPYLKASKEKIISIYTSPLSEDSYLADLYEIKVNIRAKLAAQLSATPAWKGKDGINFLDKVNGSETLLNLIATAICFRLATDNKLELDAIQELTAIFVQNKTLEEVQKLKTRLERRKSMIIQNAGNISFEKKSDLGKAAAELKAKLTQVFAFPQLSTEIIIDLNEKLALQLWSMNQLVSRSSKRSEAVSIVVSLLGSILDDIEKKYDVFNFKGKLLPSTHELLVCIQNIHTALAPKDHAFNVRVEKLKTIITTLQAVESRPRSNSNSNSNSTPKMTPPSQVATPKGAPVTPVPKSAPVPKLFNQAPAQAQTLRDAKSDPVAILPVKSSSARK